MRSRGFHYYLISLDFTISNRLAQYCNSSSNPNIELYRHAVVPSGFPLPVKSAPLYCTTPAVSTPLEITHTYQPATKNA